MGNERWLVTGGAGFIGSTTSAALASDGVDVVALDDLSRRSAPLNLAWLRESLDPRRFTFVQADVRDAAAVDAVFRAHGPFDVVVHLAGQVAVTSSLADPRADLATNVVGSFNVLEATRSHAPDAVFINASTNKVYGDLRRHRFHELATRYRDLDAPNGIGEEEPLDPHSPYGCSKASAEVYVLDYARVYGLRSVSFRQSCIYGPRQFGIEDQGWVAWFALAAELGKPLTVYGDGKQVRDLLHVDDLVALYRVAAASADACAGRAYNVGGGPASTLSLLELLARLEDRQGRALDPAFAPTRTGDQLVFVADASRAAAELGWTPSVPLDEGLEDLLGWVESHAHEADRVVRSQ